MGKLKRWWPQIVFAFLVLFLFIVNYVPGTYLTGWDNLHPEFNFSLNIQRSFFAVWQEYQGLGLLGGMAHASDLVHQLFLLILSIIIPLSMLRYIWTFLMLFVGAVGMYVFLRKTIFQPTDGKLIPFLGALFYLLNLATLQTFFAPFEPFSAFFASLPWLMLTSIAYIYKPTKKSLLLLILTLFLTTPAWYVPTLFLVYGIALAIYIVIRMIAERSFPITRLVKLYVIIVMVNSFWLFPFLYFTATNVQVSLEAKINQMATVTAYQQNLEFGDPLDFMMLKGFWFNNVDYTKTNTFDYMLQPWRNYIDNPAISAVGYLLFAIMCLGIFSSLRKRTPQAYAYTGVFVFCVLTLMNDTPPFSWINQLIRTHISLLNEAFRFPYTKFSLLAAFIFALFFAVGAQTIVNWLKNNHQKQVFIAGAIILIVVVSFPMFTGNLMYSKEKLTIPNSYFQLFSYMKTQDPATRIADMPQYTFWGWNFYNWGDGGSGFLWYGIQQPILDRAFDVWSKTDENYYFELSQALYSENPQALNAVLQKYQITWLLWDKSIVNPSSPQALFYPQFQQLLTQLPMIHKVKTFGSLELYKVALTDKPQSFVFTTPPTIPTVNSYSWNDNDVAYQTLGNYVTSSNNDQMPDASSSQTVDYPYRSLFSKKMSSDESFNAQQTTHDLLFQSTIAPHDKPVTLNIPSFTQAEPIIPVTLTSTISAKTLHLVLTLQPPVITINNKTVWNEQQNLPVSTPLDLPVPASQSAQPLIIKINGVVSDPISLTQKTTQTTFLSLQQTNILTVSKGTVVYASIVVPPSVIHIQSPKITLPSSSVQQKMLVTYPKINDKYLSLTPDISQGFTGSCDNFRNGNVSIFPIQKTQTDLHIQTQNATACTSYYSDTLSHRLGYITFINSHNITGRPLHFWILNEDEKYAPIDTYLMGNPNHDEAFILPPQDPFGRAYSLHFDNVSIGSEVSNNQLDNVQTFAIPYTFLTEMTLTTSSIQNSTAINPISNVDHANPSIYTVQTKGTTPFMLALSQSYDPGWVAYANGKELTTHIELNNWENGWLVSADQKSTTITLVYLPQYLEYAGWICLIILLIICILSSRLRRKHA